MKILVLNWQDISNPLGGGAEVHFHETFAPMVRMGHEVTLFCSSYPGAKHEETMNGIRVIREGGRYLFNYRVMFRYLTRLRREEYDIVVDDTNKIPFFTPLYVRKPLYFIVHHLFGKSIFLETIWPMAAYVYWAEKIGLALCRSRKVPIIAVSPSTKNELVEKGFPPERVDIITNCVDHKTHFRDVSKRSVNPLIGYFGRIKKYKSVEHLLESMPAVLDHCPALKLVVVGDGDYRQALERRARELRIVEHVHFTGFITEQEKVEWLQKCWFVVNTSSKEGWGLTVIEANACGTTVIAANVPGLRDAVRDGETGLLYKFGDTNELTSKIIGLLDDAAMRESLAGRAYEWSLTFDWSRNAERVLERFRTRIAEVNPAKPGAGGGTA